MATHIEVVPDIMHRLIDSLDRLGLPGRTHADDVLRWLSEASAQLPPVPPPFMLGSTKAYTRTLLHKNANYELLALHWNPGAVTMLHDHGGKQCWFAVVDGEMGVDNYCRVDGGAGAGYARLRELGNMRLAVGAIDYRADDADVHRCIATGSVTTLHLYAAPLEIFHVFDQKREHCSETTSNYDAVITH